LLIDQLLALARLDSFDRTSFARFGVDDMLGELLTSIAPWVFDRGCSIALGPAGNAQIDGNAALLKDAVRNLIENAVRHGGPGVAIEVGSEEDGSIVVRDDGGAPAPQPDRERRAGNGIGLEIVRRIAALHRARLVIEHKEAGTTAMILMKAWWPDGPVP
jgi:signal transduction histidine kinase